MKTVYEFDNDRKLISRKVVADDYTLNDHEVTVKPSDDEYPPYLINPDKTAWSGLTLEQYKQVNHLDDDERLDKPASRPVASKQPSPERQMIMQQQAQLAQLNQAKSQLESLAMKQQTALTQTQQLLMQQQLQLARLKGSK